MPHSTDYRSVLVDRFLDPHKLARENIELAQQQQKLLYDKNAKDMKYEVGQQVWLYTPNKKVACVLGERIENNSCLAGEDNSVFELLLEKVVRGKGVAITNKLTTPVMWIGNNTTIC
eukprot:gene3939-15270_t